MRKEELRKREGSRREFGKENFFVISKSSGVGRSGFAVHSTRKLFGFAEKDEESIHRSLHLWPCTKNYTNDNK